MPCTFLHKFTGSGFRCKLGIYTFAIWTIFIYGCSTINDGRDGESRVGPVLAIKGKEGTKHFIIIGFGIIRVNKLEGETAAIVTDSQALGINVSDQPGLKFGVGYSSSTVLTVPDATRAEDVRMEVSKRPFGSLKITTHSANLKDSSNKGEEKNAE